MATDALIFDDDAAFASLLAELLQMRGVSVKYFPDATAALSVIRAERPKVVFLDVVMPGINGFSICESIRSDASVADTRVIVVSGSSFPDARARAAWAEADLYLEKPLDVGAFFQELSCLLPA